MSNLADQVAQLLAQSDQQASLAQMAQYQNAYLGALGQGAGILTSANTSDYFVYPSPFTAPSIPPAPAREPDEIAWLRKRVAEISWQ